MGDAAMTFGSVEVAHQVVSFLKRRSGSGEVLGEELLDLPSRSLQTKAVWWTLSPAAVAKVLDTADVPGAANAAMHPDTGTLTVFVYDGYPGGAGFAERGYEVAARWLQVTRDAIDACECSGGCPSCVHSPKCGNGNEPLDKAAAIVLLDALLSQKP